MGSYWPSSGSYSTASWPLFESLVTRNWVWPQPTISGSCLTEAFLECRSCHGSVVTQTRGPRFESHHRWLCPWARHSTHNQLHLRGPKMSPCRSFTCNIPICQLKSDLQCLFPIGKLDPVINNRCASLTQFVSLCSLAFSLLLYFLMDPWFYISRFAEDVNSMRLQKQTKNKPL